MERLEREALDPENTDASRVRSLELIGKVIGAFAPEKQQIETVSSGFFADLSPEESDALEESMGEFPFTDGNTTIN